MSNQQGYTGEPPPFQCAICGPRTFFYVSRQSLQEHIGIEHTGKPAEQHTCDNCHASFFQKNSLYMHIRNGVCYGNRGIPPNERSEGSHGAIIPAGDTMIWEPESSTPNLAQPSGGFQNQSLEYLQRDPSRVDSSHNTRLEGSDQDFLKQLNHKDDMSMIDPRLQSSNQNLAQANNWDAQFRADATTIFDPPSVDSSHHTGLGSSGSDQNNVAQANVPLPSDAAEPDNSSMLNPWGQIHASSTFMPTMPSQDCGLDEFAPMTNDEYYEYLRRNPGQ